MIGYTRQYHSPTQAEEPCLNHGERCVIHAITQHVPRTLKSASQLLGGSSAINGMYIVRPSQTEINAWKDLIAPADATAASTWGWDSFFPALKATENFTPPSADVVSAAGMKYTESSHGKGGKLQTSFPG